MPYVKRFVSRAVPSGAADAPSITITTPGVDRDGDRVLPGSLDLTNFKKNPTLLFGHNTDELPVGRVTSIVERPDGSLRASWVWLEGDARASAVKNAWDQQILSAASIGFIPRDATPNDQGGRDYLDAELVEVSLVPVPANPQALRQLKALGLWTKSVPQNVSTSKADENMAWSAPSLKDFTSKGWGELSDSEKNHIAGHFAWQDGEGVPASFGALHLPHHEPKGGKVVLRGVIAAAGRLGQTQGIDEAAVRAHLASHYHQFDRPAPWETKGDPPIFGDGHSDFSSPPGQPRCTSCGRYGAMSDKFCASCGAEHVRVPLLPSQYQGLRATDGSVIEKEDIVIIKDGTVMGQQCPSCGQQNRDEARFCDLCGRPLPYYLGRPHDPDAPIGGGKSLDEEDLITITDDDGRSITLGEREFFALVSRCLREEAQKAMLAATGRID